MQRFSNKFVGGYISCVGRGPCRCQPSMDHLACSTEVLQQDVAAVSSMNHCDQVEVSFNLSSKEFNGRYFHNIDAWRIESLTNTGGSEIEDAPEFNTPATEEDDLPF